LRTGEAIISGEGVSIPSRVRFYKLTHAPKSADPEVSQKWNKPFSNNADDYNKLVSLLRNKKFELEDNKNDK
jgi:hypothetical protein